MQKEGIDYNEVLAPVSKQAYDPCGCCFCGNML